MIPPRTISCRRIAPPLLVLAAACAPRSSFVSDPPRRVEAPTVVARAVLPADTFAGGPPSGAQLKPEELKGRPHPFAAQPVQGFSALIAEPDGSFLALSDNGYGAKDNSTDFLLRVYRVRPDFGAGQLAVEGHFTLRDPDRQVPFPIILQDTAERLLTGGDFDPESFVRAPDGTYWFGDEFGPFLLNTDASGKLLRPPIALPDFDNGTELRSPQNPHGAPFRVQPSGGFESLALAADGLSLWALLEKPLTDSPTREVLGFRFDLQTLRFTGERFRYPLSERGVAVADLVMLGPRRGLVIERDDSQGELNGYKAVVEFTLPASGEQVARRQRVDLLHLRNGIHRTKAATAGAQRGDVGLGEPFALPYRTIEALAVLSPTLIAVANDNNYPFTVGRHTGTGAPDDTELVLVELPPGHRGDPEGRRDAAARAHAVQHRVGMGLPSAP